MKSSNKFTKNTTIFIFSIALIGFSAPLVYAKETLLISLKSIPDRIRKQNPSLAVARFKIAEAQGRLHQSGRRSNPELEINFTHNAAFKEGEFNIGISQRFPVTNRLSLEKSISRIALKKAQAEVKNVERQIIAESRKILIETLAIRQEKQLLRKQADISKQLADYIMKAAKNGEGSFLDAGQAKLETSLNLNKIHQLDAKAAALIGTLKPKLGMSADESLAITGVLPKVSLPKRSLNPSLRPDLHAANLAIQKASVVSNLERTKRRDDIELSLSGGIARNEDAPNGYETETQFSFGVKIPLPFWNKNKGAIQEADARKLRRKKEATALHSNIRHGAAAAYAEMVEWAKIANEISTTLLPLAQKQADIADQSYREGLSDLQVVMRTREQKLQLASSHLNALRDFHLAKTRYEAALGR